MEAKLISKLYELKKAFIEDAEVVVPVPYVVKGACDIESTFTGLASVPDAEEIKVNDGLLSPALLSSVFPFLKSVAIPLGLMGFGVIKDDYGFAVVQKDVKVPVSGVVYVPLDKVPFIHALKYDINVIGLHFGVYSGNQYFLSLFLDKYKDDKAWLPVADFVSKIVDESPDYFHSTISPVTYSGGGVVKSYLDVAALMKAMKSGPVALNVADSIIITVPNDGGAEWVDKFLNL